MAKEFDNDGIVDSWEVYEEKPNVLEKQLKKMSISENKNTTKSNETIILSENGHQRSNPHMSKEPKIMILQRPQKQTDALSNGMPSQKQNQPLKTLQQRQAEYAEARLRILGNSEPLEPDAPFPENTKLNLISNQSSPDEQNRNYSIVARPGAKSKDSSMDNGSYKNSNQTTCKPTVLAKSSQSNVQVIRSPRGPTSDCGFKNQSRNAVDHHS